MNRREFITLLGGSAAARPLAARAQEVGRTYQLGFVLPIGRLTPPVVAFFDELRLNGFIEGKNIATVAGSFGLEGSTPAERAATVVKGAPDLIVAGGPLNTRAAQNATPTLPIVALSDDMIGEGLTRSLAQPGGNTTGVTHSCARTRWQTAGLPDRGGARRTSDGSAGRLQCHYARATSGAARGGEIARYRAFGFYHCQGRGYCRGNQRR